MDALKCFQDCHCNNHRPLFIFFCCFLFKKCQAFLKSGQGAASLSCRMYVFVCVCDSSWRRNTFIPLQTIALAGIGLKGLRDKGLIRSYNAGKCWLEPDVECGTKQVSFHIHEQIHLFSLPSYAVCFSLAGGRVKTWKRRWFILTDNCLYYFEYTTVSRQFGVCTCVCVRTEFDHFMVHNGEGVLCQFLKRKTSSDRENVCTSGKFMQFICKNDVCSHTDLDLYLNPQKMKQYFLFEIL